MCVVAGARWGPCVGKPDASALTLNARRSPFFPSSPTPFHFSSSPRLLVSSSPRLSSYLAVPHLRVLRGIVAPLRLRPRYALLVQSRPSRTVGPVSSRARLFTRPPLHAPASSRARLFTRPPLHAPASSRARLFTHPPLHAPVSLHPGLLMSFSRLHSRLAPARSSHALLAPSRSLCALATPLRPPPCPPPHLRCQCPGCTVVSLP
ncbi:hypothetical protein DENSPDRAFT_886676 [Dentipellis sp. KUC8613]|nr:hypothetical protein DENSPDRAFT_886676 [Dentipellis sp. KUC8613]